MRDGEDNYQLYLIRPPAVLNPISLTYCLTARYYCYCHHVGQYAAAVVVGLESGKPARKLKNAADEVAQGNLRQHRNWKRGHRNSLPLVPVLTRCHRAGAHDDLSAASAF